MAAILVAAIAWSLAGTGSTRLGAGSHDEVHARHESRLEAIEAKLEQITAQLARLESVPGHSPSAASNAQRRIEQERAPEVVAAERDRQFARLDATFAAESVDAQWAPGAEHKLDAVGSTDAILSIEAAPPRERRIECRARTCRMEFLFGNQSDATDWALAYVTGIGTNLRQVQYAVQQQPDGSARVVMFGAR